jgi:hypothetical protein
MFGEVLALHDKLTVWVGAGLPVPVAESVVLEGWALLVKVRVAPSVPATCGLNITVNDAVCPAGMMIGSDKPLMLNRELLVVAAVTVTFAPVALRLPEAVPLVPTNTLPKATGAGLAVNCAGAVVPVPARARVKVGLEPSDAMVALPLALPADCGAKVTLNFALCPGGSVTGVEIPPSVKPVPLIPTCEIVTVEPPVFVTVSDCCWLLPTCTVPKLSVVGLSAS